MAWYAQGVPRVLRRVEGVLILGLPLRVLT